MRGLVFAIVLALPSCGGGGAPPNIDANPLGPVCSKQIYDLCIEEHDCETMICIPFGDFSACTTSCTAGGMACPDDKNGTPGTCDNGACKPSVPNMCHLPGQ